MVQWGIGSAFLYPLRAIGFLAPLFKHPSGTWAQCASLGSHQLSSQTKLLLGGGRRERQGVLDIFAYNWCSSHRVYLSKPRNIGDENGGHINLKEKIESKSRFNPVSL